MANSKKKKLTQKEIEKKIKEFLTPKPPLRIIGYILSDDGETRTEIWSG